MNENKKGRNHFLPFHFIGHLADFYTLFRRTRAIPSNPEPRSRILAGSGTEAGLAVNSPEKELLTVADGFVQAVAPIPGTHPNRV
jgi:hypothetical protein